MGLSFRVRFSRKGGRDFERLTKVDADKIFPKIEILKEFSRQTGNVKRLRGVKEELYRLRVGKIRVVFEVDRIRGQIWIVEVGYRDKIYKRNF